MQATAQSGTFTPLMSGLMKTSDRGPKIAAGLESLKGAARTIPMKSTGSGSPQTDDSTPALNQKGKNSSFRTPPV